MIYISTSIEPDGGDEFQILSISFMRRVSERNDKGEHKYTYGGWYQDRSGEKHYFTNYLYSNRDSNILKIVGDICLDAEGKLENKDQ